MGAYKDQLNHNAISCPLGVVDLSGRASLPGFELLCEPTGRELAGDTDESNPHRLPQWQSESSESSQGMQQTECFLSQRQSAIQVSENEKRIFLIARRSRGEVRMEE